MNELRRIDFDNDCLETVNHKYTIAKSIPVDKWIEYLTIQHEVTYGLDFRSFYGKLKEIYKARNDKDDVKSDAILYNLIQSIDKGIEKRQIPVIRLCALFLIRQDEDQTIFNQQLHDDKIKDLTTGGIDFMDFFRLALKLIPGFWDELEAISRTISQEQKKVVEKLDEIQKNYSDNQKLKQEENGKT